MDNKPGIGASPASKCIGLLPHDIPHVPVQADIKSVTYLTCSYANRVAPQAAPL